MIRTYEVEVNGRKEPVEFDDGKQEVRIGRGGGVYLSYDTIRQLNQQLDDNAKYSPDAEH